MYRFLCLLVSLGVSLPAATLIPAANFTSPTTMTFNSSGNFTSPTAYTEDGASIAEATTGVSIFVYSGILDPGVFGSGNAINVIFPSAMDRFGFLANSSVFSSRNFTISSVTFFSDTAMTSVTETYNTAFNVTGPDTFFGLQQGAGSFAAVRIAMSENATSGFSPTIDDFRFEADAVPEPASLALLGLGAGSLVIAWRRRAAVKR
ncbi:MAG: PEP-CTERM sorting domain-containing protein [Acidobacteria bacterium]|nr:PEP-CTERM sorting domain-containing protein [Acidobacteriota bacterium]